ncbi:MAG TPA: tyrosine--tRNA ligase [Solirubrobacteraceae bacterium]|nr:tyrosine--tRNA ligase [Solirubrobacteraceae bacterium]
MSNATATGPGDPVELAGALARNAVDSLPEGALADRFATAAREGRQLRVKLGIDPTAPDIHLGHAVVLRKLREFQDAGHLIVLIIGDYTARVGDPSGRSSLRPILSGEEIERNAATFQAQALKILDDDPGRLEVRRNSEWLDMPMEQLLELVRTTTAAQLLERDDFAKRWAAREPISMLELLYPILQGYDSVAVRSDVEIGGTDQKFNLLLGRDVQRAYGQPEQAIMTMPILVGIDGERKMSKSLGNQIGVTDTPEEIYGRTMRIPDEAIAEYRWLLLSPPDGGASPTGGDRRGGGAVVGGAAAQGAGEGASGVSARDAKRELARDIVSWLYSPEEAASAERHFERVIVQHERPEEIEPASFASEDGVVHLPGLIASEFGLSRSEARRLIDQGGVMLGERQLRAGEHDVASELADGQVLKVGKRRFRRLQSR